MKEGAISYQPPKGKVWILVSFFEARLCFSVLDLFDEVMREYGFSIHNITPNVVNITVGFDLVC